MIVIPNAKLTKRKLLLLLVNIHGRRINADAKAIAEAWPSGDNVERPTARAITKRFVKIRQTLAGKDGVPEFGSPKGPTTPESHPTTPKRPAKRTAASTRTPLSRSAKKARYFESDTDDSEPESPLRDISAGRQTRSDTADSARPAKSARSTIQISSDEDEDHEDEKPVGIVKKEEDYTPFASFE